MRVGRAVLAGILGALAYLGAQEVDRRIGNPRSNDLVLLGGLFASGQPQPARGIIGLLAHFGGGVAFALLYEGFARDRLPGPHWLRGILLLQLENASLWPLCYLINPVHPSVRRGDLASIVSPAYFVQQVWRHLALGAVLGVLLRPSAGRS